ncbi:MAG TPA: 50S ribosomal protein L9 [Verrucomicrobia bacterium]|nr:50S ribosomal protein L9 [Verrucomicrobiota bacterium]
MAKEVILMETVKDLGSEGSVVTVKDGYARNYLFPRKLAAPVTAATRRLLVKLQRDRAAAAQEVLTKAQLLAAKMASVSVTLAMKTSEGGHLYGSVGPAEIATALQAQGFEIARDAVEVPEHIKELGVFEAKIHLGAGVDVTVKVWVVEE